MQDVTFVVFDGLQSLDLTGPLEVLSTATIVLGDTDGYRTRVVGPSGLDEVTTTSGLRIRLDGTVDDPMPPDSTLVVAGGLGAREAVADTAFVAAVDRLAGAATRVASVCTGAFILAATGRLDGRRATTHWANCSALAESHPLVDVDPDAIYVRDGSVHDGSVHAGTVWTSAGVTAGFDLTLALVAEDHGPDLAHQVAGWLVMFVQRAGGQSQFSPQLTRSTQVDPLRDLLGWITENLDGDLSVSALAGRAAMSERHLTRLFGSELATTPASYVESVRIDTARRLLETTDLTVAEIGRRVGFRSDAVLHRAFARTVRTTPATYRRHFAARPTPDRS
jgi:transcriptional regulator GlxA family with amidase domain